jgi:WD40 repeat protein
MLTVDNNYLYYATNAGVFRLNINDKLTDEVCKFIEPNAIYVNISEDCKKYMSTNMSDVFLYEERKGLVNKFTFEKFNHIRIDYNKMLLLIIDDISISLKNLELYGIELDKCNVYIYPNPIKFQKIVFTRNSENILGIVNENFAILYECSTGKIIKVFNNNSKVLYYENCLVLTPTTSEKNYITFKLNDTSIYLYDSIKGIPLYIFKDFNAYEVKFNEGGNFLLAGTVGGNEICRLWDLENPNQFYSYLTNNKKNKNTCVCFTNDRTKIKCQSIEQNLLIFDSDTRILLYEINLKFSLNQIIGINCSNNSKHFIIIGKYNKKSICSIFEFNNDKKPNEIIILDNCPKVHIPEKGNYFITEYISENKRKENKITIWKYIPDKLEKSEIEEKKGVQFDLLNDDKIISIISPSPEGKFGLIFHLYDSHTYNNVGDLEYLLNEKPTEFIYLDLTTDLGDKIVLRKVTIQKEC